MTKLDSIDWKCGTNFLKKVDKKTQDTSFSKWVIFRPFFWHFLLYVLAFFCTTMQPLNWSMHGQCRSYTKQNKSIHCWSPCLTQKSILFHNTWTFLLLFFPNTLSFCFSCFPFHIHPLHQHTSPCFQKCCSTWTNTIHGYSILLWDLEHKSMTNSDQFCSKSNPIPSSFLLPFFIPLSIFFLFLHLFHHFRHTMVCSMSKNCLIWSLQPKECKFDHQFDQLLSFLLFHNTLTSMDWFLVCTFHHQLSIPTCLYTDVVESWYEPFQRTKKEIIFVTNLTKKWPFWPKMTKNDQKKTTNLTRFCHFPFFNNTSISIDCFHIHTFHHQLSTPSCWYTHVDQSQC